MDPKYTILTLSIAMVPLAACGELPACRVEGPDASCAAVTIVGDSMLIAQNDSPVEQTTVIVPVGVRTLAYTGASHPYVAVGFSGPGVANLEEIAITGEQDTVLAVDATSAVGLQSYKHTGSGGSSAVIATALQELQIDLETWEHRPTFLGNVREGVRVDFERQPLVCRARVQLQRTWPLSEETVDEINRCLQTAGDREASIQFSGHEDLVTLSELEQAFPLAGRITLEPAR